MILYEYSLSSENTPTDHKSSVPETWLWVLFSFSHFPFYFFFLFLTELPLFRPRSRMSTSLPESQRLKQKRYEEQQQQIKRSLIRHENVCFEFLCCVYERVIMSPIWITYFLVFIMISIWNNSWCFLSRTKKNSETYWSAEENNTPKSTRWYTQLYLPSNPIDWKKQNRATKSGQAAGILPRGGMSPPLCDTTSWSQRRSSKAQKDPWTVSSSSSICFDPPTIRRSTTVCSWRSTRPPSRCSKWSFPMSLLEHLRWNLFMISFTSVVMERYATFFSHTLIALGPQTENSSFLERNHSEQSRTIQHRLHGGSCSWNLHDWTALQGGQPVPLAIQALPSKRRLQFGR